jgi:hypothetical protein
LQQNFLYYFFSTEKAATIHAPQGFEDLYVFDIILQKPGNGLKCSVERGLLLFFIQILCPQGFALYAKDGIYKN